jgi:cytochrome c1
VLIFFWISKMNQADVQKQLRNMIAFIKQEADEKASEILAKVSVIVMIFFFFC